MVASSLQELKRVSALYDANSRATSISLSGKSRHNDEVSPSLGFPVGLR